MSYFERIFPGRPKADGHPGSPHEKHPIIISENGTALGGGSMERESGSAETEKRLSAGFDTLLEELKSRPEEFQTRIEHLKSLPDQNGILGKLEPYFDETHWEMAAVLQAYDQPTFEHSLRVASYVYEMASGGGETEAYLKEKVSLEEGSLAELFTAALFHDIGKTAIPQRILHDDHSRREWARRANEWATKNGDDHHFDPEKLRHLGDIELDTYFMELHSRNGSDPLNIVPIREIFDQETLTELEQHGISPDDTFRKILECHEKATQAVLRRRKLYVASDIASHHHDYERRPIRAERYPTELSAVRIGFELSLLRSIDVYDALTSSDRNYKKPHHPLIALEIIIKEAEAEFTEPELTKYLVRDLYRHIEAAGKHTPENDDESHALAKIRAFIAD
jgi:response regulator RpfG family c-di-GMP phosphodiesterase